MSKTCRECKFSQIDKWEATCQAPFESKHIHIQRLYAQFPFLTFPKASFIEPDDPHDCELFTAKEQG
jgi:hypothetical protein